MGSLFGYLENNSQNFLWRIYFFLFVLFFPLLRLRSFSFFLRPLGNSFHFLGCFPLSRSLNFPRIFLNFSGLFRYGFGMFFYLIVDDILAIVSWPIFFLTIRVMGFWDFCLVAGRVAAKRSKLKGGTLILPFNHYWFVLICFFFFMKSMFDLFLLGN